MFWRVQQIENGNFNRDYLPSATTSDTTNRNIKHLEGDMNTAMFVQKSCLF